MTQSTDTNPNSELPLTAIESCREYIERLATSDLPISDDAKHILDLLNEEEEAQ